MLVGWYFGSLSANHELRQFFLAAATVNESRGTSAESRVVLSRPLATFPSAALKRFQGTEQIRNAGNLVL
jgi:hypothetical protein